MFSRKPFYACAIISIEKTENLIFTAGWIFRFCRYICPYLLTRGVDSFEKQTKKHAPQNTNIRRLLLLNITATSIWKQIDLHNWSWHWSVVSWDKIKFEKWEKRNCQETVIVLLQCKVTPVNVFFISAGPFVMSGTSS